MARRTEYAINGSGGAVVSIPATLPCRRMDITEVNSAALPAQGLDYQTNEGGDNFATTHQLTPADTLALGDAVAWGNAQGNVVGWPADNPKGRTADTVVKLRSTTVTPTRVIVVEYE